MKPVLTHIALRASDPGGMIDFYRKYARLHVVHDRRNGDRRVVWLSERETDPLFVIVVIEMPGPSSRGPMHHLGFAVGSRTEVDAVAERARAEGVLVSAPVEQPPPVGYYCILSDPQGNWVEFSFGQPINPRELPPDLSSQGPRADG